MSSDGNSSTPRGAVLSSNVNESVEGNPQTAKWFQLMTRLVKGTEMLMIRSVFDLKSQRAHFFTLTSNKATSSNLRKRDWASMQNTK